MNIDTTLTAASLASAARNVFTQAGKKIRSIDASWSPSAGAPVFTIDGKYTSRGWTEWTQGFQFGSAILQFDATGDEEFLDIGRTRTRQLMAPHVSHIGVHDHGFNNVSTYGNLLRLMNEGRIPDNAWERDFYEMALKTSGAVQAARWTDIKDGGYVYSFNGPHSLFVDTIRTVRSMALAHRLGHVLMGENDRRISLLDRTLQHAQATAKYAVYYGEGRDAYDVRGRVAHESIFNVNDGNYRAPNSQQGYSPFSTWTRGLAWAMVGFAEELEFLETVDDAELVPHGGRAAVVAWMRKAAEASCDFYIEHAAAADGIPYWDTGAPELHRLGDWQDRAAEPYNEFEPVDSSAAAIGAQGLLRLGRYLKDERYWQAGLSVCRTLFGEPYLSTDDAHQGLLLHSVYHRPNGWDHVPAGRKVPCGESCMWGDYHLMELALYLLKINKHEPYLTFWS
jgi:rhamnogalacturonyl hydrolase YesR